jgi:uroporphyrinogen decarboxylase
MIPRERLLTALARGAPDCLPIMEMAIDWKVVRGLGYRSYFDLVEQLDLDGVCVNQVLYLMGLRGVSLALTRRYTDVWGVRKRLFHELMPYTTEHPVQSLADLRRYRPPDPRRDPLLGAVRKTARRFRGRRAIVLAAQAVFAASWNLCGMERLLSSYLLEPELAFELAHLVLEYNLVLHREAIRAGCEVIILSDDYAHKSGPLMSPGQFREFVLPGLTAAVANIHDAGGMCIKHTDGNVWELLEDIVGTGIDGLGPLEPAAGMDLAEVKRRYGSRVCVMGNVDVDLLCRGSTSDVQRATMTLLQTVSVGGGHILSSGNSITSAVRPENFRAMVSTARAWTALDHSRAPRRVQER